MTDKSMKNLQDAQRFVDQLLGGNVVGCAMSFTADIHFEATDEAGRVDCYVLKLPKLVMTINDDVFEIDAEISPRSMAPLLDLIRAVSVTRAMVAAPGEIQLELDSGHHLAAGSVPHFEGRELVGPAKRLLVALPGGDFAVWS